MTVALGQHRDLPSDGKSIARITLQGTAIAAGLLYLAIVLSLHHQPQDLTVFHQLAYLPIVLAASTFGLRAALLTSAIIITGFSPHFLSQLMATTALANSSTLLSGTYPLFAIAVGSLVKSSRLPEAASLKTKVMGSQDKTLSGLLSTLELRTRDTQTHSVRVAVNALVVGRHFELDSTQLKLLYWSALLHDVGKVSIPEYILNKDGRLNDSEYATVKQHCNHGAELLTSLSQEFTDISWVVRCHHERWDGKGYPQQLRGEAIPLLSRIISVVDVFEALTSKRPYRQPLASREALAYIQECSGKNFDPRVVQVFSQCFGEGQLDCDSTAVAHSRYSTVTDQPQAA